MNSIEASKRLASGDHKYVLFKGKYTKESVFISEELMEPGAENTQHVDLADIAIAQLGISTVDNQKYFIENFMGAGTCKSGSDGKNIEWVNGVSGSMGSSSKKEFDRAIHNGIEVI